MIPSGIMIAGNPFRYGSLALDEAFADRFEERAELVSDVRNGQDVVIFAPRRFGKSSLAWSAIQALSAEGVLVAQVDLMTTPSKERLASALAASIFEEIASPLERVKERALSPFRGLQVQPTITVDPQDGSLAFSFALGREPADIDATLQRLLQLPAELGGARGRRTALFLDEFQEIVEIDPRLPNLLRAEFQQQPEVSHVYLGSRRHVMERIFSDRNEPFWRSAKSVELGPIEPDLFATFISDRFQATGRRLEPSVGEAILERTEGHPYATQALCYALWEQTPEREAATPARLQDALAVVLRSEHSHFSLLWEELSRVQRLVLLALSREPGHPFQAEYRSRHALPPATNVQKALRALERREVVAGEGGAYRIVEPFLAEWLAPRPSGSLAPRNSRGASPLHPPRGSMA
jgi:uncharacterized protein